MSTDTKEEIPFPDEVDKFDFEEIDPEHLKVKDLLYGKDGEVRVTYGPGDFLVVFERGSDKFDVNAEKTFPEKLHEAGILVARLFNVSQQIQVLKDILEIYGESRESLTGAAGLPTGSHSPTEELDHHISVVVDVLDGFSEELEELGKDGVLERERDSILEELKLLGVKGFSCGGLQVRSNHAVKLNSF